MKIAAVLSTKGGPGKTTVRASLGAFCADSGLRTLLIWQINASLLVLPSQVERFAKDLSAI